MLRLKVWHACVCLLAANSALAQSPEAAPQSLATLEKNVQDRTAEWNRLAQALEPSLVRLLPCDPKIAAAIGEVTKASEERNAAIAAYFDAAIREAELQANAAKQVLASTQGVRSDLGAEKPDLAAERAALDGQLANLSQSALRRASLGSPEEALKDIVALQQRRSDSVDAAVSHAEAATSLLSDLVMRLQARQSSLNQLQTAFQNESTRWSAYYTERVSRAQTECTISKGPVPARTPVPPARTPVPPARGPAAPARGPAPAPQGNQR